MTDELRAVVARLRDECEMSFAKDDRMMADVRLLVSAFDASTDQHPMDEDMIQWAREGSTVSFRPGVSLIATDALMDLRARLERYEGQSDQRGGRGICNCARRHDPEQFDHEKHCATESFADQRGGEVTWHCSEPDSGPDVGLSIRLPNGNDLWCGEISRTNWEAAGPDAAELGDDHGWWVILYRPEPVVIGRCVSADTAETLFRALAAAPHPAEQGESSRG